MAIAYVQGVSRYGFQAVRTATTGTLISTPTSGNLLLLYVYVQDAAAGRAVTPPTGWTLIKTGNVIGSSNVTDSWMYKVAGGSESTSYTWTWDTADSFAQGAFLFELSGADTTTPIDVSATAFTAGAFDTAWSEAAITTVTDNAWDIISVTAKNAGPGFALTSPASGYSERSDDTYGAIYTGPISPAGSTGTRSGTTPNWDDQTYSFAVRPASGAPAALPPGLGPVVGMTEPMHHDAALLNY